MVHQGNLILRELAKPEVHHGPRGSTFGGETKRLVQKNNFTGHRILYKFSRRRYGSLGEKALTLRLQTICKPSVPCPGCKLVLSRLPLGITVETPNLRPGASSLSISRIKASKQRVFLTFQAIQLTVREGLRDSRR